MPKHQNALKALTEDPYVEYWGELGRFIHYFSRTEHTLKRLLQTLAGTSDEVSGAIFIGVRMGTAKDHINRILEAKGDAVAKNRLEGPFAQLGVIGGVRDNLVHWGAEHEGTDDLLVSNARQSPGPGRVREYRVSPRDLVAMTEDLVRINMFLVVTMRPLDDDERIWGQYLGQPWRYKSPQQAPPKKGTRARRRARLLQPDASQN